jgi:hypothetical protein
MNGDNIHHNSCKISVRLSAHGTKRKCSLKAQMSVVGVEQTWLAIAATSDFDPEGTSNKTASFMPKSPLTPSDTDWTRYDAAH